MRAAALEERAGPREQTGCVNCRVRSQRQEASPAPPDRPPAPAWPRSFLPPRGRGVRALGPAGSPASCPPPRIIRAASRTRVSALLETNPRWPRLQPQSQQGAPVPASCEPAGRPRGGSSDTRAGRRSQGLCCPQSRPQGKVLATSFFPGSARFVWEKRGRDSRAGPRPVHLLVWARPPVRAPPPRSVPSRGLVGCPEVLTGSSCCSRFSLFTEQRLAFSRRKLGVKSFSNL